MLERIAVDQHDDRSRRRRQGEQHRANQRRLGVGGMDHRHRHQGQQTEKGHTQPFQRVHMGLTEADTERPAGLERDHLLQHHLLGRRPGDTPSRQEQQAVAAAAHRRIGLPLGQQWPFGDHGTGIIDDSLLHPVPLTGGLHPGQHLQAMDGFGFLQHRIHRPVMGGPGIVGQKGQGQREQHADNIDERPHHTGQRAHPAAPRRAHHGVMHRQDGNQGAQSGDGGIGVMFVGQHLDHPPPTFPAVGKLPEPR